jgi:hypothetical protein
LRRGASSQAGGRRRRLSFANNARAASLKLSQSPAIAAHRSSRHRKQGADPLRHH